MLIAQITDMHVVLPDDPMAELYQTADRLAEAVRHLNITVNKPDMVFMTGDLVNCGKVKEYELLRELISPLGMPVYLMAGNHDDCDNLRSVFPDHDYLPATGPLCYAINDGPLKLIALDTNLPGKSQGQLGDAQLAWLDAELQACTDRNALIFMHHPPFRTGLVTMDDMNLIDADAFGEVVSRHSNIERILCGHLHRATQTLYKGTLAQTCPSTSHQINLLLGETNELETVKEPPELLLHYWTEEDGLVTHNDYVKNYPAVWKMKSGVQ
ncbi:phosphodiesterase [Sneathiella marina]|uniref:Phosphodiesterase n=1 Tax=Sneathiella marina TaxID=2950108 RepID=A0ABY4VYF7_9PROT|nr:phosphodiesterase [Sneathiella marina]USG59961.1 phosphodiesterase [Sneathiella marina]